MATTNKNYVLRIYQRIKNMVSTYKVVSPQRL